MSFRLPRTSTSKDFQDTSGVPLLQGEGNDLDNRISCMSEILMSQTPNKLDTLIISYWLLDY